MLDHSLEDIAQLLDTTVNAVKAHLARGRARLKEINSAGSATAGGEARTLGGGRALRDAVQSAQLGGLRALLADDVKLRQSAHPLRARPMSACSSASTPGAGG